MLQQLATLALVALAVQSSAAQSISTDGKGNINVNTPTNGNLVVKRREESTIRISDMVADIQANAKMMEKMQNNAALYTSAQQFMQNLASDTIKATTEIKVTQSKTDSTLATLTSDMKKVGDTVDQKLKAAQDKIDLAMKKASDEAAAAAKKAKEDAVTAAAAAKKEATASTAAIKKMVEDALKPLKAVGTNYGKDSLYFLHDHYQLLRWTVGKGGSRGADRVFYKIDYNPGASGSFNTDRRELKKGCADLSADLKARDGVDRALKPACNRPQYCDSAGVSLSGSYLSHYGCNTGSYNINVAGYGLPLDFSMGAVMYDRDGSWNGHNMLLNEGKACHHAWTNYHDHSTKKGRSTLCTGSNGNYKKKPV